MKNTLAIVLVVGLCAAGCLSAQQVTTVPRLVRISNTFHPANGQSADLRAQLERLAPHSP